jgi:hypothetical protein
MRERLRTWFGPEWPAALVLLGLLVFVYLAVCFGPANRPPVLPPELTPTTLPPGG